MLHGKLFVRSGNYNRPYGARLWVDEGDPAPWPSYMGDSYPDGQANTNWFNYLLAAKVDLFFRFHWYSLRLSQKLRAQRRLEKHKKKLENWD